MGIVTKNATKIPGKTGVSPEGRLAEVQASLTRLQDDLAGLIRTIPLLLAVLDEEDRVVEWNRSCREHLGVGGDQLWGKCLHDQDLPWDRDAVARACAACRQDGRSVALERLEFSRIDGRKGHLKLGVHPMAGGEGEGRSLLLLGEDITEYITLQSQLSHALKMEA
ncbi:MAG: PAS domain S-box protein, partial [Deltaproteobacteria bacterium]|nr:PAS domain S-box protein [Deltaproteobacteria bacterium]